MTEEIRQNGCTVLASCSEHAIPMIFNNLCGKNFSGKGFKPGRIELYRDGELLKTGYIPKF